MAARTSIAVLELCPARGRRRALREGAVIGRDAACEVWLDDPLTSRRHAVVLTHNGEVFIEDLGSSNGLFVNGERCLRSLALQFGDVVQIGTTLWKVVR